MSKCDLTIVFDRPDRQYRGGEEVTGSVQVSVNADVLCEGLSIEHRWQTHGRGNRATGPRLSSVVFKGQWRAGESVSYPFRFTAPNGPPTYRGHYLNIDHYVRARADIPWALDPKTEEEYTLLPGVGQYGNLPDVKTGQGNAVQTGLKSFGIPIGIAMICGGVIIPLFGIVLIPGGCIVLFFALRQVMAEKKLGKVDLHCGPSEVAPGSDLPVRLFFTPSTAGQLNQITAKLTGVERCVSGSGTNKSTHTHKLHNRTVTLCGQRELQPNQPVALECHVPIPQTTAFSFSAHHNDLIWQLEIRIDIPLWPDWIEKRILTVRPGVETGEETAVEAPIVAETAVEATLIEATVVEKAPFATQPAETPVFPIQPPSIEQPPEAFLEEPAPAAGDGHAELIDIVAGIATASRYGSERAKLIEEHAGKTFPCSIDISTIEKTYSYGSDDRFRDGRKIIGQISGTDCKASLQLLASRNEELDALDPEATVKIDCMLLKWNNIYDRLEMQEP